MFVGSPRKSCTRYEAAARRQPSLKALVTGGAGFIGSNLVDALLDRGDDVVVLDNLVNRPPLEPRAGARARRAAGRGGHPRRRRSWARCSRSEQPEVVFHLAAQMDVRVSTAKPAYDAEINVIGTINMLEAARAVRRAPVRVRLHRRRDLRRDRRAPDARGRRDQPRGALRPGEVLGRGLLRPVAPAARPLDREPAVRQRLRPAPGPARRGRRGRDLLRQAPRRRPADRLRRRPPDARLHICGGRRPGGADRGRAATSPAPSTSARGEETSVLDLVDPLRKLGRELRHHRHRRRFEAQFAPARAGEVQRSALDPSQVARGARLRGEVDLEDGLRRTLEWVAEEHAQRARASCATPSAAGMSEADARLRRTAA